MRCVCARPVSCASVRAEEAYSMAATAPERNRPDRTALLCPVRSATVLVCVVGPVPPLSTHVLAARFLQQSAAVAAASSAAAAADVRVV